MPIHVILFRKILKLYFTESEPSIGVLGLNPHAGENGLLGNEEQQIILPAIKSLQNQGLKIDGPLAADSAFLQEPNRDVILSLYHDQICTSIQIQQPSLSSECCTLGLGIIRTSVDHGIALDQAGKKHADFQKLAFCLEHSKRWLIMRKNPQT